MVHRLPPTVHPQPDDDPIAAMGEPQWTSYGRAILAADDARQRLQAAQVSGDLNAIAEAEWSRMEAVTEVYRIKERLANQFLFMARFAAELYPGSIAVHLDPTYRRELNVVEEVVGGCETRLDEIEDYIVAQERQAVGA